MSWETQYDRLEGVLRGEFKSNVRGGEEILSQRGVWNHFETHR